MLGEIYNMISEPMDSKLSPLPPAVKDSSMIDTPMEMSSILRQMDSFSSRWRF